MSFFKSVKNYFYYLKLKKNNKKNQFSFTQRVNNTVITFQI